MLGDYNFLPFFIEDMLPKTGMEASEFCSFANISYKSFCHWRDGSARSDDPPPELMLGFAHALGLNQPGRIYNWWFEGKPTLNVRPVEEIEYSNLMLHGLVKGVRDEDYQLKAALNYAIEGRRFYTLGLLHESIEGHRNAIKAANEAKEIVLALYIKLHLLNVYEMTAHFVEGASLYDEILGDIGILRKEANRSSDETLLRTLASIEGMVELRWLWMEEWAKGATSSSIDRAFTLADKLKASNAIQNVPYAYEFIARVHAVIGNYDKAIKYIEEAVQYVYAMEHPANKRYLWFLDAGVPLADGYPDIIWQRDQIRTAKFSLLTTVGKPREAIETFRMIIVQGSPETHLSIHGFFDHKLQAELRKQNLVTSSRDVKLRYTPDEYDERLSKSGDIRIRASNLVSQGGYFLACGDIVKAQGKYELAIREAKRCKARDIIVEGNLGVIEVAIKLRDQTLATRSLSVIQEALRSYDNPYLAKRFQSAERAVRQTFV